jgi:hypothetical protein
MVTAYRSFFTAPVPLGQPLGIYLGEDDQEASQISEMDQCVRGVKFIRMIGIIGVKSIFEKPMGHQQFASFFWLRFGCCIGLPSLTPVGSGKP